MTSQLESMAIPASKFVIHSGLDVKFFFYLPFCSLLFLAWHSCLLSIDFMLLCRTWIAIPLSLSWFLAALLCSLISEFFLSLPCMHVPHSHRMKYIPPLVSYLSLSVFTLVSFLLKVWFVWNPIPMSKSLTALSRGFLIALQNGAVPCYSFQC